MAAAKELRGGFGGIGRTGERCEVGEVLAVRVQGALAAAGEERADQPLGGRWPVVRRAKGQGKLPNWGEGEGLASGVVGHRYRWERAATKITGIFGAERKSRPVQGLDMP